MRVWRLSRCIWPPEEDVLVTDGQIEVDFAIGRLVCVGRVARKSIRCTEPLWHSSQLVCPPYSLLN